MPTVRARLLQLALENLAGKKKQIDMEIAQIESELGRRQPEAAATGTPVASTSRRAGAVRKRSRFSKAERERRSARMKAYWENWRKQKKQKARS